MIDAQQESINTTTDRRLKTMEREAHLRGRDVEVGQTDGTRTARFILRSPNGNRWAITVSNAGVLGATAL